MPPYLYKFALAIFAALLFTSPSLCLRQANAVYNKTLIHNITQLLNTILNNQDKNFRPDIGVKPLAVTISISVRSMGPISEQNMEFSLDCYFRQQWYDERIRFEPIGPLTQMPLASKMLKDIWRPDTYIRNGRQSYLHTLTVPNILLRVRNDGRILLSQRLTIRTRCQMFLHKFPMDTQACSVEIGSLGHQTKDLYYQWVTSGNGTGVEIDEKMGDQLSQHKLLTTIVSSANISDPRDPKQKLSVLRVYFKLQRQQGFYILQIYTPCTLIVVMSWVSFWINKEASPARVALGIMTVLSMSTIGFGMRTDMPKVSHSTALDIYIISCFGFVFAALVEYAVINFAHIVYIRKTVAKMRMFAGTLMGDRQTGRMSMQVDQDELAAFEDEDEDDRKWHERLICCRKAQQHSVFYRMAVRAAKARKKLKMDDPAEVVNRVDDVSKFLFPALYILFNLFYWVTFFYWLPDEIDNILSNVAAASRLQFE